MTPAGARPCRPARRPSRLPSRPRLVVLRALRRVRTNEEVGEELVTRVLGAQLKLREQLGELVGGHVLHGAWGSWLGPVGGTVLFRSECGRSRWSAPSPLVGMKLGGSRPTEDKACLEPGLPFWSTEPIARRLSFPGQPALRLRRRPPSIDGAYRR